jgi:hypothetical protein
MKMFLQRLRWMVSYRIYMRLIYNSSKSPGPTGKWSKRKNCMLWSDNNPQLVTQGVKRMMICGRIWPIFFNVTVNKLLGTSADHCGNWARIRLWFRQDGLKAEWSYISLQYKYPAISQRPNFTKDMTMQYDKMSSIPPHIFRIVVIPCGDKKGKCTSQNRNQFNVYEMNLICKQINALNCNEQLRLSGRYAVVNRSRMWFQYDGNAPSMFCNQRCS